MASSPSASGSPSRSPPSAPAIVPTCQATYWVADAPNRSQRSKLPSPRPASAHEASTTAWPCAARLSGPPGSDGPSAAPIGRKREFISAAAPIAAPTVPPPPMIAIAVNCAEPANTISRHDDRRERRTGRRPARPRRRRRPAGSRPRRTGCPRAPPAGRRGRPRPLSRHRAAEQEGADDGDHEREHREGVPDHADDREHDSHDGHRSRRRRRPRRAGMRAAHACAWRELGRNSVSGRPWP